MTKVFSDGELCMALLLLLIIHVSGVQIFERKSDLSVMLVAQMFIGLKARRGSRQISLHRWAALYISHSPHLLLPVHYVQREVRSQFRYASDALHVQLDRHIGAAGLR